MGGIGGPPLSTPTYQLKVATTDLFHQQRQLAPSGGSGGGGESLRRSAMQESIQKELTGRRDKGNSFRSSAVLLWRRR